MGRASASPYGHQLEVQLPVRGGEHSKRGALPDLGFEREGLPKMTKGSSKKNKDEWPEGEAPAKQEDEVRPSLEQPTRMDLLFEKSNMVCLANDM